MEWWLIRTALRHYWTKRAIAEALIRGSADFDGELLLHQVLDRRRWPFAFHTPVARPPRVHVRGALGPRCERASKRRLYENYLKPFFGEMYVDEIGVAQFRAFLVEAKQQRLVDDGGVPLSDKYINNILGVLSKALKVRRGRVSGRAGAAGRHLPDRAARDRVLGLRPVRATWSQRRERIVLAVARQTDPEKRIVEMLSARACGKAVAKAVGRDQKAV